ncbi:Uncharacterised protein [Bordetella pertussis]|nr:Uncharacterised protein [Bordetella pertussis]CFV97131.1 Uncharacterised protein [Bordetella pertussis]CPO26150.1 Uncharacterised protein [Bordetella pertussis]CPO43432.1 Uncharacterised protein [Bordetella pertussis]
MTRQSNPESGTLAHCATGDVMMGNTSEKNAKRRRRRARQAGRDSRRFSAS